MLQSPTLTLDLETLQNTDILHTYEVTTFDFIRIQQKQGNLSEKSSKN